MQDQDRQDIKTTRPVITGQRAVISAGHYQASATSAQMLAKNETQKTRGWPHALRLPYSNLSVEEVAGVNWRDNLDEMEDEWE